MFSFVIVSELHCIILNKILIIAFKYFGLKVIIVYFRTWSQQGSR